MDLYTDFVWLIRSYLINGIFISVLIVWIATFIKRIDIHYAKSILKWIMIGYACLAIVNYVITLIDEFLSPIEFSGYSFGERAFGNGWFAFWFMLIGSLALPFILLSKRIGTNLIFLFLVAVLMNIGWLFESFIVIVTSFHRDYIPAGFGRKGSIPFLPYGNEVYLLKGLILGMVVLIVGNLLYKTRNKA
jgi:hypothetical protein